MYKKIVYEFKLVIYDNILHSTYVYRGDFLRNLTNCYYILNV